MSDKLIEASPLFFVRPFGGVRLPGTTGLVSSCRIAGGNVLRLLWLLLTSAPSR